MFTEHTHTTDKHVINPRTGTVQYNEISIGHMVNLHNSTLDPAPSLSSCYVYILRMFLFSLILPFMQKKSNTGPFYRTREERSLTTRPHTRVEQHSFRRRTTVTMQTVDVALTSQSKLWASQLKNSHVTYIVNWLNSLSPCLMKIIMLKFIISIDTWKWPNQRPSLTECLRCGL